MMMRAPVIKVKSKDVQGGEDVRMIASRRRQVMLKEKEKNQPGLKKLPHPTQCPRRKEGMIPRKGSDQNTIQVVRP